MLFQNIVKRKKVLGAAVWEAPMWEQRPQIEDALSAPPYSSAGDPAGDYMGHAGGDALNFLKICMYLDMFSCVDTCKFRRSSEIILSMEGVATITSTRTSYESHFIFRDGGNIGRGVGLGFWAGGEVSRTCPSQRHDGRVLPGDIVGGTHAASTQLQAS
jgi:hypothetical protein